ncbi:Non-histone chromosomal protein 6 [Thelohanellus kitauei]|uniref:Non-histone chromosomal protein 6 n=1 Tax=Thelohanellus kitauei TaxID=669202 RepID=A0A0C2M3Y9_THEKT|nr:Non-histone chromosomal protein 6 [Thelohanellus kitauei]
MTTWRFFSCQIKRTLKLNKQGHCAESKFVMNADQGSSGEEKSAQPILTASQLLKEWGPEECSRLLETISLFEVEFNKMHPKTTMIRKHINWSRVAEILAEQGEEKEPELLRKAFYAICGRIRTERRLPNVIADAKEFIKKMATPALTNPYNIFRIKTQKKIRKRNPGATLGEIASLISKKWKNLSDERRKKYEEKAQIINDEIKLNNPDHFANKRRHTPNIRKRLSFEPELAVPPHTTFSYFYSKFPKDQYKNYVERRNAARSAFYSLPPDELNKYCSELDQLNKNFEDYLSTLPQIQRDEYRNFVEMSRNKHKKKE